MSMKLIYHTDESASGGVSPFDEAIVKIVSSQKISIICPYLNLEYLSRIISLSTSWRLLTDVEEWIKSNNKAEQDKIKTFISTNSEYVHHCRNLHAKAIIAGDKALIGSANFTNRGITKRIEVSVLIEEEPQIEELKTWCNKLWIQSEPVKLDELTKFINSCPPSPAIAERPENSITSYVPEIKSKLLQKTRPITKTTLVSQKVDAHEQLVEKVKLSKDRNWIDSYLNLMKELLDITGLDSDDARLVTSTPQSYGILPVTINNRYVLSSYRKKNDLLLGIIFPAIFENIEELKEKTKYYGKFKPLSGESSLDTPFYLRIECASKATVPEEFKKGWVSALLKETNRATGSPFRRHHEPLVYKAIMDLDYRQKVLDDAFN
jgi:PLD-like domain